MLQKLNERVKGVVAWVIVIMIAFTFTLFGIDYYLQSRGVADKALDVDGVNVSKQEFDIYYRRARQQIDPATMTKQKEQLLKDQILQDIVSKQVALAAAETNGFYVDVQQANAAILAIPQFQEDGSFSAARYQQALSVAMFTPETFQKEVRQGLILNQQRFALMGTAFALPFEVTRFIKLYFQKRDYDYLLIPFAQYMERQTVKESEARKYYDNHQAEFLNPEKVRVDYLVVSLDKERHVQSKRITEKQVKAYYDENKQNFIQPARWQISRILISTQGNDDQEAFKKAQKIAEQAQADTSRFDELMKKHTDDKFALNNQNNLPWVSASQDKFGSILMNLKKTGAVSKPFKTKYGYEIYQVKQYKPASIKPFAAVANMIRQQLINGVAEKNFNRKLETLTDLTFQTPDSLEPAAKAVSEPVETTPFFTRQGTKKGLTSRPPFIQAAFSHDVLDLNNNSEQIQLDGDKVVFLRVKEHQVATEKSFKQVKPLIRQILKREKAAKFVKALGQSFIDGKLDAKALAKKLSVPELNWITKHKVSREPANTSADINHLAFSIQAPDHVAGKVLPKQGYLIVKLKSIYPGDIKSIDTEQRAGLKQQLESNMGTMAYDFYLSGLLKKATVNNHL